MKCPRCKGFMLQDKIIDLDGPFHHIPIWRCINCGGTLDLAIRKGQDMRDSLVEKGKAA